MKSLLLSILTGSALVAATPSSPLPTPRDGRTVSCSATGNVQISVAAGMTTVINMPKGEYVKQVFGGDEDWNLKDQNGAGKAVASQILPVEPKKKGIRTLLNVTGNGTTRCTFVVSEIGLTNESAFDTNIFIEGQGPKKDTTPFSDVQWVPAYEVKSYKDDADRAVRDSEEKAKAAKDDAAKKVELFRASYPESLKFDYAWDRQAGERLGVLAIWHDADRTFIYAPAIHLFTIYELRDGKPVVVNFAPKDGLYTIQDHIVEDGYITNGLKKKDKLEFHLGKKG